MDRGSNSEPGFYGARPDATRGNPRFPPDRSVWQSRAACGLLRCRDRIPDYCGILRSPGVEKETDSMRVRTAEEADARYIRLEESAFVGSEEVSPGVILDFDEGGGVVGIEFLNVRERLPGADLKRVEVEVA